MRLLNTLRRRLAGAAAFLGLALVALPGLAHALTVTAAPADSAVTLGDEFYVRLSTDGSTDLRAYHLVYKYDPTRLQFMGASPGALALGASCGIAPLTQADYAAPADSVIFDVAMLGCSVNGPGELARFKFKTIDRGDATVQCELIDFRNSLNVHTFPSCSGSLIHIPFEILASAGTGGSISPSGSVVVMPGATQAFTITADPCYTFTGLLVDGNSVTPVTPYTFTNVQSNHTIAASFTLNGPYTITASAGTGGSISPSGPVSVACGANQPFTITADPCYTYTGLLVDGNSVTPVTPYTFTDVQTGHTIAASFTLNGPYTITASAGTGGSISPSGPVSVACGANQPFTITADPCYTYTGLLVDGNSVTPVTPYTFTNVQSNHTIAASFTLNGPYTITASAGTGGSISPSGPVSVACGANQSFTITADPCYTYTGLLVDGNSVTPVSPYTFTNVQSNHTIAASFTLNGPYTITASAGTGGSISPSGPVSVACGANQSFTITADPCYTYTGLLVDGNSVTPVSPYTFTNVQSNHTIAASFTLNGPYTITASAGTGGSISPSGPVSVACGATQAFTITASACYTYTGLLVDGSSVTPVTPYTFTNVQIGHTIAASFTLNGPYTITASAGTGGSISPSGPVSVACGANQSFTITADPCYTILDVLVDNVSVGPAGSYPFLNVQSNHTIVASFTPVVPTITAVTALSAAQVRLNNDTDGTTKITLTFTPPAGAASIEVWRKGYGNYPEYNNPPAPGSVPSPPGSYPPAGWTLTGVTASGQTDEPATRDYWYYVAYAKDACNNVSTVSTMTGGTLDYHLGDVHDGTTNCTGNNKVFTEDVSYLGSHYGQSLHDPPILGDAPNCLDVGPTTTNYVDGRPTPDNRVDFEDLILFAINFYAGPGVGPSVASRAERNAQTASAIGFEVGTLPEVGGTFDVLVRLQSAGDVQAVSARFDYDPAIVEPLGVSGGELLARQAGLAMALSPEGGMIDAAVFGHDLAFEGSGELGRVTFRLKAAGEPRIELGAVLARDSHNRPILLGRITPVTAAVAGQPKSLELASSYPNPFVHSTTVMLGLPRATTVKLGIYDLQGRLVNTLLNGAMPAGWTRVSWDGTSESGVKAAPGGYLIRLAADGRVLRRTVFMIR